MSPYNAYSSSLSSSRLSSYTPSSKYSGSTGYSTLSSYRYKPPAYSSTLSSKYLSPSTYSSYGTSSSYTASSLNRNYSPSYLSTRSPKFNSVSSYASAISSSNDWKSSADSTTERLWRSPSLSLSRRNSSSSLVTLPRTPDRSARPSLPAYTTLANGPTSRAGPSSASWSDASDDDDKTGLRVGLNNLGNTCFMNAILQTLLHTQPLVDYFRNRTYLRDINIRSSSNGDWARAFDDFTQIMLNLGEMASFSPFDVRKQLQKYAPLFAGDNQQDAQEFLRFILHGMHEDLNRVKNKPSHRSSDRPRNSRDAWLRYLETDNSIITDTFAGQLKSTLRCSQCNNDSITYDAFMDLSVPLPEGASSTTLRKCLSLFTATEILDGPNKPYCEVCKMKTSSSKKIEISRFPKVLAIHLKRFAATGFNQKLNTMVDCPLNLGSLSEFGPSSNQEGSYSLYSVVDHIGTFSAGHYISKCYDRESKKWREFNDSKVSKLTTKLITNKAYMLFYNRD